MLAIGLTVISLMSLPYVSRPGAVISPFLPSVLSIMMISEFVTSFLLFDQFVLTKKVPLLILASTYLYSGAIIIPHLLTFPSIFSQTGWLGATPETATWLWVFWHGGVPIGFTLYALSSRFSGISRRAPKHPALLASLVAVLVLLCVGFIAIAAIHFTSHLPVIIQQGDYQKLLTSGIGPAVWLLNVVAVATLFYHLKSATLIRLGVSIASIASLLDVTLTLCAGIRYSVGWYIARFDSLFAGIVVLLFLLGEIVRLYQVLILQQRRITDMAYHDPLTGLGNRRWFADKLNDWLQSAELMGQAAVVMFDLDGFKQVNDELGHEAGDELLAVIAKRLEHSVRETDVVARLGGDEFIFLIRSLGEIEHFTQIAARIIEVVQQPIELSGRTVTVTASVGIAPLVASGQTQSSLIRRADNALYEAKRMGKNQYVFADFSLVE